MFGLSKTTYIYAPVKGKLLELENVNDEMFAKKLLGDGFAIEPSDNIVRCPIDGEIVMVSENGYAFGIKNRKKIEVLVHIGIDTVNLQGKGFHSLLKEGQFVKAGDEAVKLDLEYLKSTHYPITTMVVITSNETIKELKKINEDVTCKDIVAVL